ncbi:MAG TPA: acyl carrier protein [Rhizomicrobium sp.]|jgi:acyl carrier protein|nr:acyl carrier protein [Rhizomicrobium sp.]
MATDENLTKVTEIIRDLFDEYDGPVTRDLTARQVSQWDSLAHVQLMVMVEQACGVKFSSHEIRQFDNLGDLLDLVANKKKSAKA